MISFDKCFWLYGGGVFNEEHNKNGSHLLLIIGWDNEKGAWLVKNSYGTDWGESGFGWINTGATTSDNGQPSSFPIRKPKNELPVRTRSGSDLGNVFI